MHKDLGKLIAVLDLGSHSFYLTLFRPPFLSEDNFKPQFVEQLREPVCLWGGLDENYHFNEQIIKRACKSLKVFREYLNSLGVCHVLAVSTSAVRLAQNREAFLAKAQNVLGFPIEVLTGEEEAALIYQGFIHQEGEISDKQLVVDIGGGSSEIILGQGSEIFKLVSLELGCITLQKTYFPDHTLSRSAFSKAVKGALQYFKPKAKAFMALDWEKAWMTAGISKSILKALSVCLEAPQTCLTRTSLLRLEEYILDFTCLEALQLLGLEADRALILPSGLAIFTALMETFDIDTLYLSEANLRAGLIDRVYKTQMQS